MTAQVKDFVSYTIETGRSAIGDYFAPLTQFFGRVLRVLRVPVIIFDTIKAVETLDNYSRQQDEVLRTAHMIKEICIGLNHQIGELRGEIGAVHDTQTRDLPTLIEGVERRLEGVERRLIESGRSYASQFTPRQREVLQLLAEGRSRQEVERRFGGVERRLIESGRSYVHLTPRQREVLKLLAEGRSMKEVAKILSISPRTVAFHKHHMMEQLHLKTNADLILFAIREGIVPIERSH